MPAKAQEYSIPLAFRLTEDQSAVVDHWARKLGLSRAAVIRMLISLARDGDGPLRIANPSAWSEAAFGAASEAGNGAA